MKPPGRPLFLERETYRARRATDAARLLPVLGFAALCLPLLWRGPRGDAGSTSSGGLFLFGLWLGLILAAVVLARMLRGPGPRAPGDEDDG